MMKILLLAFLLCLSLSIKAQDEEYPPHVQTTAPPSSRFEIIQSHLAARWTFLLDKTSGKIKQLVRTKNDDLTWEDMFVSGLPKVPIDAKVRYQLFSSGLAAKHTFLLNVDNGQTWVLTTLKDEKLGDTTMWLPFKN